MAYERVVLGAVGTIYGECGGLFTVWGLSDGEGLFLVVCNVYNKGAMVTVQDYCWLCELSTVC